MAEWPWLLIGMASPRCAEALHRDEMPLQHSMTTGYLVCVTSMCAAVVCGSARFNNYTAIHLAMMGSEQLLHLMLSSCTLSHNAPCGVPSSILLLSCDMIHADIISVDVYTDTPKIVRLRRFYLSSVSPVLHSPSATGKPIGWQVCNGEVARCVHVLCVFLAFVSSPSFQKVRCYISLLIASLLPRRYRS